jgi:hypothetical protein
VRYALPGGAALPSASVVGSVVDAAGGSVVDGISSGVDAAKTSIGLAAAGAKWITNRHNIMRVVYGIAGVGLVVAAAAQLGAPAASKIVSVATPIGRAASVAGAATKGK